METLNSKALDMLKKQCSCASKVTAYMKHIIIDLDSSNIDTNIIELKEEIIALVKKHIPLREDILPFTINKQGESELEFTIPKSTVPA